MNPDVFLLIIFLLIALGFPFFCSVAEAVLLSISPSYTATLKNSGNSTAELVTLEDLVETLFGLEIVDAADHAEDMQVLARQRWAERARGLGLGVDGVNQPIDPSQPEK